MPFEMEEKTNCCDAQITSKDTYKQRSRRARKTATGKRTTVEKQNKNQGSSKAKGNDATSDLYFRKLIVAEWQRIAAVVDRVLFWLYLMGTIASYVVILIVIPKSNYDHWNSEIKHLPQIRSDSRYTM